MMAIHSMSVDYYLILLHHMYVCTQQYGHAEVGIRRQEGYNSEISRDTATTLIESLAKLY